MDKEYVQSLEKRVEELEDVVAAYNPTTLNILNLLIEQKRQSFEKNKTRFGQGVSDFFLFKEICTIRFNLGRAMGHTTALKTIYLKDPLTTIYIVPRKAMLMNFQGGLFLDGLHDYLTGRTFTSKLILADSFMGNNEEAINKLYQVVGERIISQGTPPIFVVT